jgi:hypothetical protein
MLEGSQSNALNHLYHTSGLPNSFAIDPALSEDNIYATPTAAIPAERISTDAYGTEKTGEDDSEDTRIDDRGKFQKWCPNCETWIPLGSSKGSEYAFREHFLSQRCRKKAKRIAQERRGGTAQGSYQSVTRSMGHDPSKSTVMRGFSAPPSSPIQPRHTRALRRSEIDASADEDEEIDNIHHSSKPIGLDETDMVPEYKCAGVWLDWPVGSFYETYPWQVHNSPMDVPWIFFAIQDHGVQFWVHSVSCSETVYIRNTTRLPCKQVNANPRLKELQERARSNPGPSMPYIYLTNLQLQDLLKQKVELLKTARLEVST